MNHLTAIAASVTTAINAASLSMPVVAQRSYKPAFDLQELADLRVTIVPQKTTPATATRTSQQDDLIVDIGVQQRVDPSDLDEMDALMHLVSEVDHSLRHQAMEADQTLASWLQSETQLVHDHLLHHRTFTAVIRLTYRLIDL